jgi:hypothetical protein
MVTATVPVTRYFSHGCHDHVPSTTRTVPIGAGQVEGVALVEPCGALELGGVRGHQPRSARRCGCGISSTLMPTMASPRPRETFAMTSGSS